MRTYYFPTPQDFRVVQCTGKLPHNVFCFNSSGSLWHYMLIYPVLFKPYSACCECPTTRDVLKLLEGESGMLPALHR